MTETPETLTAYDPDTTPGDFHGQSLVTDPGAPTAPETAGETFTDEDGNARHVPARDDGRPVAIKTSVSDEGLSAVGVICAVLLVILALTLGLAAHPVFFLILVVALLALFL